MVDGFLHHLGSVQAYCIMQGLLCFILGRSTWSAVFVCKFVNIAPDEYPIAADLFTLDCTFLGKLAHSADRDTKHGGHFFHVH